MNKNEDGNGETSISTSRLCMEISKEQPHTTDNKIEGENSSKTMKRGESSSSGVGNEAVASQELSVEETTINDLPVEMLTKILTTFDNRSLFQFRLVSHKWSAISSGILTGRPEIMLKFKDYDIKESPTNYKPVKEKNNKLQEFVELMKSCQSFPYARFSFDFEEPSFFNDADWIGFISLFAPSNPNPNPSEIQDQIHKIKCLYLKCERIDSRKLGRFTEKLIDSLGKTTLEELGLKFYGCTDTKKSKLFLPTKNTRGALPVQLKYLRVLEIEHDMFGKCARVIERLLQAAVNLTTIRVDFPCSIEGVGTSHIFQFLHSLGKLHLLKKVDIDVDEDFLSSMRNLAQPTNSSFPLGFKLHELRLHAFARDIGPTFYADATNFISTLLESSKDTLEKIKIPPLGFLHELQFPKFRKLRTLELGTWDYNRTADREPFFPAGTRAESKSREFFSTVVNLSLRMEDWQRAFPQHDSIPVFHRAEHVCLRDVGFAENAISTLALMCPKLKHCTIKTDEGNPEQFNFPQIGRVIWTHLDQLESLEVDLDVNLLNHAFPALDSCFTGISIENCRRLSDLMEAEKTKNKGESPVKLPESEEFMTLTQRVHPSILDMKNLKTLTINPYSFKIRLEGKHFFTTKITWISEEFAFKLMPHLQFNGRRPSANS